MANFSVGRGVFFFVFLAAQMICGSASLRVSFRYGLYRLEEGGAL